MTLFYCQNPAQSGDTTGMGIALVFHPENHLLLLVNFDEVDRALQFLQYYRAMGVGVERLHVVICDTDAKNRTKKAPALKQELQLLSQPETQALIVHKVKAPEASSRKLKQALTARDKLISEHFVAPMLAWQAKQKKLMEIEKTPAWRELKALAGEVREWPGNSKLYAANQLYQILANPDEPPPMAVQAFFDTATHAYRHIGQSTTDIKAHLLQKGTEPIKLFHKRLSSECPEEIKRYAKAFVENLLTQHGLDGTLPSNPVKQAAMAKKKDTPLVVLIWVRGLSGGERTEIMKALQKGVSIEDSNLSTLDGYKRNPHHVTTVQLYLSIMSMLEQLSRTTSRRYIGVPVGDTLFYDQYAPVVSEYLGKKDENLIGFFGKCASFQCELAGKKFANRFTQLQFFYQLYRDARIALMQVGIRSGGMEGGMYMGIPTVYIEEQFSPTGPRMAQMTQEGELHSALDALFLQARKAVSADEERLTRLSRFRDEVQGALLPTSITRLSDRYVDALFDDWTQRTPQDNLEPLKGAVRTVTASLANRAQTRSPYPFFFRLVTRNLLGLNQSTLKEIEALTDSLVHGSLLLEERLLRGTLTRAEVSNLRSLIHTISMGYPAYYAALAQWSNQTIKPLQDYLPRVELDL